MRVASLKKKNNDVLIIFDDGTFYKVDYRAVIDFGIRKGDEFDEVKLNELLSAGSFLKARDSAYRFLARRMHSKYELKLKLSKKKFDDELIEKVLSELESKKLINEKEFVEHYLKERIEKKRSGSAKVRNELQRKGIRRDFVDQSLEQINPEIFKENIMVLAEKKLAQLRIKENDPIKIKSKLFAFLFQRGYESDLIHDCINSLQIKTED